jgi:hypothetical protein
LADANDRRLTRAVEVLGALYRSSSTFRALANQVRDEGGVEIQTLHDGRSAAVFFGTRVIGVSPRVMSNDGSSANQSLVGSLVFEMSNLSRADQFSAVYGLAEFNAFDAAGYARAIEHVEYQTTQACAQIFTEGRDSLRAFGQAHPESWFLNSDSRGGSPQPMYSSFEDYMHAQQEGLHTAPYEAEFRERHG